MTMWTSVKSTGKAILHVSSYVRRTIVCETHVRHRTPCGAYLKLAERCHGTTNLIKIILCLLPKYCHGKTKVIQILSGLPPEY